MTELTEAEINALLVVADIDRALDNWKNQSMIAQTAVVDLLLDLRALANANGH